MIEKIDFSSGKSSVLMGILLSIIIIALVSSSMFFRNLGRTDSSPVSMDFSTFPGEQNIGSEIPPLIYADENIAISFINPALIIYDFKSKSIVDSVDMSFFSNNEFNDISAKATKDGKTVYFNRMNHDSGKSDAEIFQYSISTRTLEKKSATEKLENCVTLVENKEPIEKYAHIDENFAAMYVCDILNDKFAYIGSTSSHTKDLYIGIIDRKTEKLEKYNLFKS